ncbi:MAG TPA: DUF202 domain-containing protein [Dermatophilaceae bacterium]|nr:DUF202 domain-containing protein [Dermatophilaceae bacterium]
MTGPARHGGVPPDRTPTDRTPTDRGAQNERTALAWTRTTLAMGGLGLVAARLAILRGLGAGVWLAAASLVGCAVTLALARRRYAVNRSAVEAGRLATDAVLPASITVTTLLLGLVGAALVLG